MEHQDPVSPASQNEAVNRYPTFYRSSSAKKLLMSPVRIKKQLRPLIIESMSKNMQGVPRRVEEMLKSPLHSANEDIHSVSVTSKIPSSHASYSKANFGRQSPNQVDCATGHKFGFNKQNVHKIENLPSSASQSEDVKVPTYLRSPTEYRSIEEVKMQIKPSSTFNKNQLRRHMPPPTIATIEDFNLFESMAKNSRGEPRRIEEMLKSPLHCATSKFSSTHASKSKANLVRPSPRNQMDKNVQNKHILGSLSTSVIKSDDVVRVRTFLRSPTEPRSTDELRQSQLQMKINPVSTSNKNQLRPPTTITFTKDFNLLESLSKNSRGEPRRIEEMLKSPLHCASAKNIRSIPSTSKIPSTSASVCVPRRKLDFDKKTMRNDEERILNYLKQIPDFRVILKRGMHTMNVDDFVSITNHLLPFSGIQLKLNQDNYIEQTICAMQLLKYPYKVNKSVLRTPSLFFRSVIRIFDFLLDFAPAEDECLFKDFNFYSKEYKIWRDTQSKLHDDLFDATPKQ